MRFGEGKYWRKWDLRMCLVYPFESSRATNQTFTALYSLQWAVPKRLLLHPPDRLVQLHLRVSNQKKGCSCRARASRPTTCYLSVIIKYLTKLSRVRRFSPSQVKIPAAPLPLGSREEPGQCFSPFLPCPPSQSQKESFAPFSSTTRERGGGNKSTWKQLLDETHTQD